MVFTKKQRTPEFRAGALSEKKSRAEKPAIFINLYGQ
jgi:hypothetical protein